MPEELGAAIRAERERQNLSLVDLASRSGVSKNMIATVEQGGNVSVDTLEKIATTLGINQLPLRTFNLVTDGFNLSHVHSVVKRIALEASYLDERLSASSLAESRDASFRSLPSRAEVHDSNTLSYLTPPGRTIADLPFEAPRGLSSNLAEFPVKGYVAAGEPIDEETHGETVLLPRAFVGDNEEVLRARGESMIEWGIHDGDYVIVERRSLAATGELVIAWYNEGITIKQWFYKHGRRMLIAGNPNSPSYEINHDDICEIRAVVTGIWKSATQIIGKNKVPLERRPKKAK